MQGSGKTDRQGTVRAEAQVEVPQALLPHGCPASFNLPDQEIVGCGSSGSQDQSDKDTGQEVYGVSSAAAKLPRVTDLRGGWGCQ